MRHVGLACLLAALFATASLAGCGRTELDFPEDVPHPDVPVADTPVPDGGCVTNAQCDNGVFCDGTELCVAGACQSSAPVNCADDIGCTDDRCDEPTRVCVHTPDAMLCPTGEMCDPAMGCTMAGCTSDAMCDDGNPCDGIETCAAGRCVRSPPPSCDDGVPCTDDACLLGRGCVNTPVDARCDNGVFCDGVERCTAAAHGCTRGAPTDCSDTNACTQDVCSETVHACLHPPTDADGDGFPPIACRGTDCDDTNPRINPGATEVCNNAIDDNCDGRADCADPFCASDPACRMMCVPTGSENDAMSCHDGRDDDCNGTADCADPQCAVFCGCVPRGPENNVMSCTDGVDDDCDGLIDCADPGCAPLAPCTTPPNDNCTTPTVIGVPGSASGSTTGAHDDFNASCAPSSPAPDVVYTFTNPVAQTIRIDTFGSDYDTVLFVRRTICATGPDVACDDDSPMGLSSVLTMVDAPAGTYFVFVDGFAASSGAYQLHITLPREVCHNGTDDDGNGLVDCADPECFTDPGCAMMCVPTGPENNPMACADGRDDDCNGLIDCADPGCRALPACMMCVPTGLENTAFNCADGRDNDCNGLTDCADPGCARFPFCATCHPTGPENNPMACSDGRDNDCDGRIDCADPDCSSIGMCACVAAPENTDATCSDGRDNDCDRLTDCADPDCAMTTPCRSCVPTGAENTAMLCADGRDNNCNGLTDCADPSCAAFPSCIVTPPNDTCASPTVIGVPGAAMGTTVGAHDDFSAMCTSSTPAPDVVYTFTNPVMQTIVIDTFGSDFDTVLIVRHTNCATGPDIACDDDSSMGTTSVLTLNNASPGTYFVIVDGFADASGNFQLHITIPREICNNGLDDNGNGLTDCADPECFTDPSCAMMCRPTGPENSALTCSDGRDNDCDGLIDCADPGCAAVTSCCRMRTEVCTNHVDDNCNGLIDCADPGCAADPSCARCVPTGARELGVAECTNGTDDDCDGLIDCADPDCQPFPGAMAECCNGRDDNGNGAIDEFACACTTNAQCVGIGAGGRFPSNTCYETTLSVCGPACNTLGGDVFCNGLLPGSRCNASTGQCM